MKGFTGFLIGPNITFKLAACWALRCTAAHTNFSFALKLHKTFSMFAGARCLLKQLKQQQWKIHMETGSLQNEDLVPPSNDIK